MNDERPIEKLLRRAAKKRNDEAGTPPELHPANRRLLQAEVARQFPQLNAPQRMATPPFWVALTRRWAYALALIPVIGILALVLVPTLTKSKSNSSMNLAQNSPTGSARVPVVLADESIAPQPGSVTASLADSSEPVHTVTLEASGGGNLVGRNFDSPAITAPPMTAAPLARADRESSARREFTGDATIATDSLGVNRKAEQPTYQVESKPESLTKNAPTESFSRTAPASVALSPAPTRSVAMSGISGAPAGAVAKSAVVAGRDQGGTTGEKRVTNYYAAVAKEFDAPAQTTLTGNVGAIALTEAAKDGFSDDKSWVARGGGAERQRATLNSQAYSNLGAEQADAKKKDLRLNKLAAPVLVNFKVEQAGRDLRVVDGDGSVYNGVVDEENTLYKQQIARQQQKLAIANESKFKFQTPKVSDTLALGKQQQQEAEYYLYRVEGTNRSLNQNVIFTWNFVDTNALAAGNQTFNNAAQKLDATKLPSQFPALLQNSYINGRAQFGEGREVEVNAVPVKP